MDRMIEIQTVPIQLEMKVSHASLEYSRGTAEFEISREGGKLNIKSQPIRLNIDSFNARNSIVPTPATALKQYAQMGKQAAYEATATYARHGQILLRAKVGQDIQGEFAKEVMEKDIKTNVGIKFIPSEPIEMDWDPGELNIRYEIEKMNIDWQIDPMSFEFTPGNIEFVVTQKPDVIIRYVGGPLSITPSDSQSIDIFA